MDAEKAALCQGLKALQRLGLKAVKVTPGEGGEVSLTLRFHEPKPRTSRKREEVPVWQSPR